MNLAVARAARRRNAGATGDPTAQPAPEWRPFQLAFILINIAGLVNRTHADREIADLLFFPTGGGKTEAYLGLAAFAMVLRRLRHPGEKGGRQRRRERDHALRAAAPDARSACTRCRTCMRVGA